MSHVRSSRTSHTALRPSKPRVSRIARQPCFTMKRPLLFQVRKSLVEYVDDELLEMSTSVFYQRIFILAKNVEPPRLSAEPVKPTVTLGATITKEMEDAPVASSGSDDSTASQPAKGASDGSEPETVTQTFRFDADSAGQVSNNNDEEEEQEEEEQVKPVIAGPAAPKDMFIQFSEKLQFLARRCMKLAYTPDPMCGLLIYMNEYTMLMLESGEDMMGIFCGELLACCSDFWQSNRVFMIEDHIDKLYTKELIFRRISPAWINEKFPTSTPTDEYLMGKQHLIIKEKMHAICRNIAASLDPISQTESEVTFLSQPFGSEMLMDEGDEEEDRSPTTQEEMPLKRSIVSIASTILPPDIYRKLLPEIQRIELVLASTRFYYTLREFFDLYGTVPFGRDDDSFWWPIQNNYAPPNIFQRTPYDINLTFAEYAAEMARRMQEEADRHKAQQEAQAEAEALAAEAEAAQAKPTKQAKQEE